MNVYAEKHGRSIGEEISQSLVDRSMARMDSNGFKTDMDCSIGQCLVSSPSTICGYVADRLKIWYPQIFHGSHHSHKTKSQTLWHNKMAFPMAFSGGKPDRPPCR